MKADPEYREVVEYLATLLSERPGRMEQTLRIAAAGHALLIKVL